MLVLGKLLKLVSMGNLLHPTLGDTVCEGARLLEGSGCIETMCCFHPC